MQFATNTYAVIDDNGIVQHVWTDPRDAGDPDLQAEAGTLAAHHGGQWVWVDGSCAVGDTLSVDDDGCAVVA